MVNILAGSAIILIFAYSAIFSADSGNYPVECVHVAAYGQQCPTCGISHSFSEIIRGNISSAAGYNRNGPLLFGFFFFQLLLRTVTGGILTRMGGRKSPASRVVAEAGNYRPDAPEENPAGRKVKILAWSDAAISLILFLFCFRHLLVLI